MKFWESHSRQASSFSQKYTKIHEEKMYILWYQSDTVFYGIVILANLYLIPLLWSHFKRARLLRGKHDKLSKVSKRKKVKRLLRILSSWYIAWDTNILIIICQSWQGLQKEDLNRKYMIGILSLTDKLNLWQRKLFEKTLFEVLKFFLSSKTVFGMDLIS